MDKQKPDWLNKKREMEACGVGERRLLLPYSLIIIIIYIYITLVTKANQKNVKE